MFLVVFAFQDLTGLENMLFLTDINTHVIKARHFCNVYLLFSSRSCVTIGNVFVEFKCTNANPWPSFVAHKAHSAYAYILMLLYFRLNLVRCCVGTFSLPLPPDSVACRVLFCVRFSASFAYLMIKP